jgi:ribosomal protein L3 glutamine methyltransferase
MARLFHINVGDWIASATRRLKRARVYFGHGTDNATTRRPALVLQVMKLPADANVKVLTRRVSAAQRERFEALLKRRIEDRVPLPYLTHEAWFAGFRSTSTNAC